MMSPKIPPKAVPKIAPKMAPKQAPKVAAKPAAKDPPKKMLIKRAPPKPAVSLERAVSDNPGPELDVVSASGPQEAQVAEPIKKPLPRMPVKAPPKEKPDLSHLPHHQKMVQLARGISKVHGRGAFQVTPQFYKQNFISTRSIALDLQLNGGVAVGRVICLVGEASGGKTSTAIDICAEAQTLCGNCYRPIWDRKVMFEMVEDPETKLVSEVYWQEGFCDCVASGLVLLRPLPGETPETFKARKDRLTVNSYRECRVAIIDVEGTMSWPWAIAKGLDPRLVSYSRPVSAEEAVDIQAGLVESGLYDLVLLDSVAELTPAKEIEDSAEDQHRALASKLINRTARVVQANINKSYRASDVQVTLIWIQQWRMKMNAGLWEDPRVMPGGKGQDYLYSQVVDFSSKAEKAEQADGATKESGFKRSDMTHIRFHVRKNKLGASAGGGSYDMWTAGPYKGRIDDSALLLSQAKALGVITNDKSWMVGGHSFKTQKDLVEWLYDPSDPERLWSVKQRMIEAFHPGSEVDLSEAKLQTLDADDV